MEVRRKIPSPLVLREGLCLKHPASAGDAGEPLRALVRQLWCHTTATEMLTIALAAGGLPGHPLLAPHVHPRCPAGLIPAAPITLASRHPRQILPNSPVGTFQEKQKALPVLPNLKWQGDARVPLVGHLVSS